jgi:hypothetical protein
MQEICEKVHKTFVQQRLTMREAVIRTLERKMPGQFKLKEDQAENSEHDLEESQDEIKAACTNRNSQEQEMQMLQTQGFFTLSDISAALAMNKEEKTMSRILQEIRKVHKRIAEKANRYGRKFQYTYFLEGVAGTASPQSNKGLSSRAQRASNRNASVGSEELVKTDANASAAKLELVLNQESSLQISVNLKERYAGVVKVFFVPGQTEIDEQRMLIDYFRHIITLHTSGANQILRGRRTLTTQHLDRYIFCLNKV